MKTIVAASLSLALSANAAAQPDARLVAEVRPQIERFLEESGSICARLSIDGGRGELVYYRPERPPPPEELKKYDALLAAGALRPIERPDRPHWQWFEKVDADLMAHPGGVCYGKRTLAEIVEITPEEIKSDCWRFREVKYRYRVSGVPAWAKHPLVAQAYPDLLRLEGELVERTFDLMFYDGRWLLHEYDPVHKPYFCPE